MTARTKADDVAATRLLNAAVRKAREEIAEAPVGTIRDHARVVTYAWRSYDHRRAAIVAMLAEATRTAALLIDGEAS